MHPAPHRTPVTPQTWQAYSAPRGSPSTGLLQGLIQHARPASFCFLLPRVHAADVTDAQPAQMLSSSSSSSPSSTSSSSNSMPSRIGKPEFPDTGWGRIKDLFDLDDKRVYPEEVTNLIYGSMVAMLSGSIYGGLPAARHARQRYIEMSQAEIYTCRVEAVRSAHNAAIRGFLRYGWRWGWRVTVFVTLFSSVSTGLSVYRDKDALSHYAAAGAVTGGLFRLNLGLVGMLAGSILGAVMGVPAGAVILGLQSLSGEMQRERRRRERRELYELQLQEWSARLQMTDELIGDLNTSCQEQEAKRDVEKITELLASPQKAEVSKNASSQ